MRSDSTSRRASAPALFGGLPATGAIARTATNIRSGAHTPIAGIVHALTLLLILLVAAPLAGHIPLAILAALLMVVAYDMGEWAEVPDILRLGWSDAAVWLITVTLTIVADLTVEVAPDKQGRILIPQRLLQGVEIGDTALPSIRIVPAGEYYALVLFAIVGMNARGVDIQRPRSPPQHIRRNRLLGQRLAGEADWLPARLERGSPSLPFAGGFGDCGGGAGHGVLRAA